VKFIGDTTTGDWSDGTPRWSWNPAFRFKIRWCKHGWSPIPGDLPGLSSVCPVCYPIRPVHVTREDWNAPARHCYTKIIWSTIRSHWRIRNDYEALEGYQEGRLKLLRRADKIQKIVDLAGHYAAANEFVRRCVINMILDYQSPNRKTAKARNHYVHTKLIVPFEFSQDGSNEEEYWEDISRGSHNIDGSKHGVRQDGSSDTWATSITNRMTVDEALEALSPSHRTAFDMLYCGENLGTIADKMGVSVKTVRRRLIELADVANQ
jgi:RNA polymerase sigma factor (sigma-70 family)